MRGHGLARQRPQDAEAGIGFRVLGFGLGVYCCECSAFRVRGSGFIVPLKYIEYGVFGDLIIRYARPYSIYLRGL